MELREHLFNLPQELFDKIYNLTFAVDTSTAVLIYKGRKPPVQLQINRATRRDFARRYYGSPAGFRLDYRYFHEKIESWLLLLPASHRRLIQRVELMTDPWAPVFYFGRQTLRHVHGTLLQYHRLFDLLGIRFAWPGVLHVEYRDESTGEKTWLSLYSPVINQLRN